MTSTRPLAEKDSNLVQIFLSRASEFGTRPALSWFSKPGGVKTRVYLSWRDWAARVEQAALALRHYGIKAGDRVGILSENRFEWTVADLAILSLGAVGVPVYPTSSCADIRYFTENAGIEFFFVSTAEQLQRTREVMLEHPGIRCVTIFDSPGTLAHPRLLSFDNFLKTGQAQLSAGQSFLKDCAASVSPDQPATIIYTSGTTGSPKGVVLSHRNFVENYLGAREVIHLSPRDTALSFLPLNHVFERLAGYYFMAFHGALIVYAENMQTVAEDMALVRPTVAAAVPRFYEKVYAGVMEKLAHAGTLQKKIFYWALKLGKRRYDHYLKKTFSFKDAFLYKIAEILVFSKIKKKLGGKLRFFISGGAPLSRDLAEFFYAAGILILEGYGLTETSPVIAVNTEKEFRFGTVGKPLKNVGVRIAEDGEILTSGPCVMLGYYKNPLATSECIHDGWFHTGDIGVLDQDGYLHITDRKKDIIATSGGKKISPANVESAILGDPLFAQAVVVGDKRNYLTALIVPNRQELIKKAEELGVPAAPWEALLKNADICEWAGTRLRARMAPLAPYEQVKYFRFLPAEMTLQSGELTPTLKVKRKVVIEKYQFLIDEMYQSGTLRNESRDR